MIGEATKQKPDNPKPQNTLDFREAYFERLTHKQRLEAKQRFCKVFSHKPTAFSQVLSGGIKVSRREVEWMQSYDPNNY